MGRISGPMNPGSFADSYSVAVSNSRNAWSAAGPICRISGASLIAVRFPGLWRLDLGRDDISAVRHRISPENHVDKSSIETMLSHRACLKNLEIAHIWSIVFFNAVRLISPRV